MSVKTYTDSTTRIITKTIEEHVWEIRCDAIGCNNSLEFRENQDTPVSVLSRVFGKPSHTFDPCDYTAYEPLDNYTKKTCLWTGGGFQMPPRNQDMTLPPADRNRIWYMSGKDRANNRSKTPLGFARAVYEVNQGKATEE